MDACCSLFACAHGLDNSGSAGNGITAGINTFTAGCSVLVGTYTAAAVGALKEAGITEVGEFSLIRLKANYSDYQKLMPLISAINAKIEESDFATDVFLTVMVRQEQAQSFMADITESTNGRVASEIVGTKTDFI